MGLATGMYPLGTGLHGAPGRFWIIIGEGIACGRDQPVCAVPGLRELSETAPLAIVAPPEHRMASSVS
jgi:hypothetical protein